MNTGEAAVVTEDRQGDRHRQHQRGHHRRLITHGEALDDVRGVAGLAGAGQALHRLVGVCV